MNDEESCELAPEKRELWELLTRIANDPNPGVRRLGLLIYQLTVAEGQREVRLSYAQIEEDAEMTPRQARTRVEYMERKKMIERRRTGGRPGTKRGDPRGNLYRLALTETPAPGEEAAPTRAGPTNKRPGDASNVSEPQDGLVPPDKGAEPDNHSQI